MQMRLLVVTIPGSQAQVRRFYSPLDPQEDWPSRYKYVRHCVGQSLVHLQLKKNLELFVKRREFLPSFYLIAICPKLLKTTSKPISSFL